MTTHEKLTDPYGALVYAVGSGDDFICFDYHVDTKRKRVLLHAVVNSETGSFIQDFAAPEWFDFADANAAAEGLVYRALDWCADGGQYIRHSTKGWNQDPHYFARMVAWEVATAQGQRQRKPGRIRRAR